MRTLMVDFITSLDGYAAADGWPGYWGTRVPRLAGTTARPHRAYGGEDLSTNVGIRYGEPGG